MEITRVDPVDRDVKGWYIEISGAELARVSHDLPWRTADEDCSVADKLLLLAVIAKRLEEDEALRRLEEQDILASQGRA